MAKKKGVKKAIKAAASGGITKEEFKSIADQYSTSPQSIVQKADKINKKAKAKGGTPYVSLNSGAANMLIKQAGKNTSPFLQPSYGSGRIGRALQSMIGTPASSGTYIKGQRVGAREGTPSSLMIGGTQIRPGGKTAVRGIGKSPRATGIRKGGGGSKNAKGPYDDMDLTPSTPGVDPGPWASGYKYPESGDLQETPTTPMTPGEMAAASSIDGMTGGGEGMAGAVGLRRPKSRYRKENRTNKGTKNLTRSLQIGSPLNFA